MILVLLVALAIGALYGLAIPTAALVLVFSLVAEAVGAQVSWPSLFLCVPLMLAIPVSVGLISATLESLAITGSQRTSVIPLAIVIAITLLLSEIDSAKYIASFLQQQSSSSSTQSLVLLLESFNKGFYLVLVVTFIVSSLCLLCEIPFYLLGEGFCSLSLSKLSAAVRPLVLITLLYFVSHILIQIFVQGLKG